MQLRVNGRKFFVAVALIGASLWMAPSVVAEEEVSESSSPAELRAYVDRLDELIKRDPQGKYYASKGQALDWLGDRKGAVVAFTKKLEISPDDRKVRYKRADNLRRLSRLKEALVDYDKLIDSGERKTFIYSGRSICRSLLKDYRGGLADAERAISLDKNSENGWFAKGCAEYNSRTSDLGISSFSNAISINPKCKDCLAMRSKAYLAKGQLAQSKADLKQARLLGFEE